ncbi:MAG: hypothetical protein KGV59_00370 [Tenacibaculum sp.]|nr:hypothetical protein [Tenacibaculum sp.]
MIIWSGRGFLLVLVLFASFVFCGFVLPPEMAKYIFVFSAYITGLFGWFFGKKWNIKNERNLIDEETGERIKIRNQHTLFWIPMQYWGIIFLILGTVLLFFSISSSFGN